MSLVNEDIPLPLVWEGSHFGTEQTINCPQASDFK